MGADILTGSALFPLTADTSPEGGHDCRVGRWDCVWDEDDSKERYAQITYPKCCGFPGLNERQQWQEETKSLSQL